MLLRNVTEKAILPLYQSLADGGHGLLPAAAAGRHRCRIGLQAGEGAAFNELGNDDQIVFGPADVVVVLMPCSGCA